jgi:sulfur-carrier protein adenylyltransferase/sulfurtransferase
MKTILTPEEKLRYARNIKIPSLGEPGQIKLGNSSALIVGLGGLGSASGFYLAAAGVGRLGLVDYDEVELSNLNRQVLHSSLRIGMQKVESAKMALHELNPGLKLDVYPINFISPSAEEIIQKYDVIIDGTDNFEARFLINRLCVQYNRPFVYGAVFQFGGQASVFDATRGPCFQCVFHHLPPREVIEANRKPGVIGALPGIIGTIQAVEAIKLMLKIGKPLIGRLLMVDGLDMKFTDISIARDSKCPICNVEQAR